MSDSVNAWIKSIGEQLMNYCEFSAGDFRQKIINLGNYHYKKIFYYEDKPYKIVYVYNNLETKIIEINKEICGNCNEQNKKIFFCEDCDNYHCDECGNLTHKT